MDRGIDLAEAEAMAARFEKAGMPRVAAMLRAMAAELRRCGGAD
jgi:hypothetical protein